MNKKILVVSHEYPPIGGGGANACYFLTKEFAERGYAVDVVTANFMGLPDIEEKNGVRLHRLNSARSKKDHCSFKEMLSFVTKAMPYSQNLHKENKYDICLVFFGIPSGPVGYVLKKKYKLPYIIRFGGGDIPGFQDRFTKVYKLIGPAIKAIWRNADCLIANSQGLRQMALDYYDKKDFMVIPNGVDTEYFAPAENPQQRGYINILFVSRLIERKGLQFIIPQLKKLKEEVSQQVRLTIVGDGPYRETLEHIVSENGLADLVHFAGHKEKNEIVPYYQDADMFILPSKKEGMPNVVLEAMACGLPVVMTPCQGASELIDGNGFVVNTDEFKDKLAELIKNDQLRKEMGQESRRRACEVFGWKRTADAYIEVIEKLVK